MLKKGDLSLQQWALIWDSDFPYACWASPGFSQLSPLSVQFERQSWGQPPDSARKGQARASLERKGKGFRPRSQLNFINAFTPLIHDILPHLVQLWTCLGPLARTVRPEPINTGASCPRMLYRASTLDRQQRLSSAEPSLGESRQFPLILNLSLLICKTRGWLAVLFPTCPPHLQKAGLLLQSA